MSSNYDYADLFDKANNKIDLLQNSNDKQDQEIYIEAKMALVEIQQLCKAGGSIPICEIVQKYYDEKLAEAKEKAKESYKPLKAKYSPIIKETKAVYKAKCKVAKVEVKKYKKELKDNYNAKCNEIKASRWFC